MAYEDPVESLVKTLREKVSEEDVRRLSASRLNDAGDIYERYGYGTAREYLIGKESYLDKVLVSVLEEIHQTVQQGKVRAETGAYILRRLRPILTYQERR